MMHLVPGIVGAVESKIEDCSGSHDPAHMGKTFLDDFDRAVGEHAISMHHIEVPCGQERQGEVVCECEPRHLVFELVFHQYLLSRKQYLRRDIDAAVIASL